MEITYHNSQQDLPYLVSHFHFDIDLLRLAFKFSNQYPNQYQNGNNLPNKVSPVDDYGMDLPF
jgi:hypothetical protein